MTSCLHVETDGGAYSPIRPCQRSTCDHCPVWASRQYLETCFRFCHNGTQVIWINWFWICMSWISLGSLTAFFPTLPILKSQSVQHCTAVPTSWRDALVAADSIPFPKFAWSRRAIWSPDPYWRRPEDIPWHFAKLVSYAPLGNGTDSRSWAQQSLDAPIKNGNRRLRPNGQPCTDMLDHLAAFDARTWEPVCFTRASPVESHATFVQSCGIRASDHFRPSQVQGFCQ